MSVFKCLFFSRLQCCGLKVGEVPPSVVPHPFEVCGSPEDRDKRDRHSDSSDHCDIMLAHRRATTTKDPQTPNIENGLIHNKSSAGARTASIRDKISQWEGKKESSHVAATGTCLLSTTQKEMDIVRKKESKVSGVQRTDSKKFVSWERQDSGKENLGKFGDSSPKCPNDSANNEKCCASKPNELQDKKTVLTHVKKLEKATKEVPQKPSLAFPGNYFCPPSKEDLEGTEKKGNEPIFGTFHKARPVGMHRRRDGDSENEYCEPGAPSINPLPKPQRTFQHHTPSTSSSPCFGKAKRTLPPLPSIPPPPLPTCPPPGVCRRPWVDRARDSHNR